MTCPDGPEPAGFLRQAMNQHQDHLEPKFDEVGRLKRKIAILERHIETMRLELVARRFEDPNLVWHPPNPPYHDGILTRDGIDIYG